MQSIFPGFFCVCHVPAPTRGWLRRIRDCSILREMFCEVFCKVKLLDYVEMQVLAQ